MKKIFFALALLAGLQVASAQDVKSVDKAKAAAEKAQADALNPKKNTKGQTWIKLGQAYVDAYNAPMGNAWVGISKQELQLVGGGEKPVSVEDAVVNGQPMTKEVYATKNYYFASNGVLNFIEVTAPIYPDALDKALEAYSKALVVDPKAKVKDILTGLETVAKKYVDEAYNAYSFGNLEKASENFEKAAIAAGTAPLSQLDTNSIYNAGFTALAAGNHARAKVFLQQALDYGYYGSEGDVYAKLASIAEAEGNKEEQIAILEKGFTAFPQSQQILVGLINYYITSGESTDKLFDLLDIAKVNEPENPSLYYVEGNIRLKLDQVEEAIAAYKQCETINPEYEFGYIGLGILYYNEAIKIQEAAQNEFDDAKYMALVAEFEKTLKNCVEPFEKAFEVTKDAQVKVSVAEYLKNACFRFRTDEVYAAKYEKFEAYVAENQ